MNSFGAIDIRVWSVFDLDNAAKHNTVTVTAEIIAMIVKDMAFFFIRYIIDDVNTTSVIDTRPFLDFFKVLKISDTELLKNK